MSLRDEFNENMKKEKNVQKYTILSEDIQSNTGTIFYQYKLLENGLSRGQLISLSVFLKQGEDWKLKFSGGCNDKWNISSYENEKENIYCGTINDPIYTNVLIGDKKAKIIKLKNSNSKAWFYLNSNPSLSITAEREDGSIEIWQPSSKKK
ncbi:hypothetical protein [Gottfriedia luciferensis]|uniref:hypothetical protein n=1 Tax=Gottfriedia luciferensis TaxID=178774 RepID=UPI000B4436E5|nr:hypothetical protein [Gottfriedia luciferensis]